MICFTHEKGYHMFLTRGTLLNIIHKYSSIAINIDANNVKDIVKNIIPLQKFANLFI